MVRWSQNLMDARVSLAGEGWLGSSRAFTAFAPSRTIGSRPRDDGGLTQAPRLRWGIGLRWRATRAPRRTRAGRWAGESQRRPVALPQLITAHPSTHDSPALCHSAPRAFTHPHIRDRDLQSCSSSGSLLESRSGPFLASAEARAKSCERLLARDSFCAPDDRPGSPSQSPRASGATQMVTDPRLVEAVRRAFGT